MNKKSVDYFKLHYSKGKNCDICLKEHLEQSYLVLDAHIYNIWEDASLSEKDVWDEACKASLKKQLFKLKKKIRKYDLSDTVIYLDKVFGILLSKEMLAYNARKYELLQNRYEICNVLSGGKQGRSNFLLYIGGDYLSYAELLQLLLVVKDFFEDITICFEGGEDKVKRALNFLQKEWGVIINLCTDLNYLENHYDGSIVIVLKQDDINDISVRLNRSYLLLVEEIPTEFCIYRGILNDEDKHFFSGFCYRVNNQILPYQMAVDFIYQNKKKIKIESSSVDIYEAKWYNN